MKHTRWIADNIRNPSITCIPEEIVRDIVFRFLPEEEAFESRGTCLLFSSSYFEQPYTDAYNLRVLAMLLRGYRYRKLEKITLEYNMIDHLCPLRHLPALEKFTYNCPYDFDLETLPINLVHLRKLKVTEYPLKKLSYLCHFSALQEIDLSGSQMIEVETIPTDLVCLEKLVLTSCDIRDLSSLRRFQNLLQLDLSYNHNLQLATMPNNLKQL